MADANVPEADVPMVLHVQMRDRFNKVLPRAIGIRRVHEWGRDVWAVIFPLTEDYLRQHPDSTGYGREVHVSSDGGEIYVPEFEADPSRADALCAEPLAR